MILDDICQLARYLRVQPHAPETGGVGYMQSHANHVLGYIEQHLQIEDKSGSLRERLERCKELAFQKVDQALGFEQDTGTSFGRSGFKKSHRNEGVNYVD
jgi:hypothetical protein